MTTGQAQRAGRVAGLVGAFAGLALGLVLAASPPRAVVAAQKEEPKYPDAPAGHKLIGAAVCQDCHDRPDPTKVPLYKQTLGYEFIRLWENKVWGVHDLHSQAYLNLLTDRTAKKKGETPNKTAQKMEDHLRKYKGDAYLVATDTACLACHASVKEPVKQAPHDKWTLKSFDTIDGVGCEMCHGHGSSYQSKHQDSVVDEAKAPEGAQRFVEWRDWPPAQKEKWGLVNLRDPATATAKCASCHVGNTSEGRFVTHDMYAVGHPPLPPLDLMTYSREQPRHWGLAGEMPYITKLAKKDAKKAQDVFHYRADESLVARRFAESTVATLGATATLGGQLADAGKDDGLDYAAFDCYSCHHNLKYPSERQDRGYVGRPGRPLFRPAAFALARVVVGHAAESPEGADLKGALDALNAAERELADAFTTKSYGDPAKIKAATEKINKWSEDTRKKLAAVKYDTDQTKKLLAKVVAATQQPLGDPEAAQLYAWAFETLVIELSGTPADQTKAPEAVDELRKKLDGVVVTKLRPKTRVHYEQGRDENPPKDALESVSDRVGPRMELFNSFRGEPFRKAFQEVKPTFPK